VRKIVVKATIKVDEKPQILGTRSSLTAESIDLKFDSDDYVSDATHTPKMVQTGPAGLTRQNGLFFFIYFCQALESTFLGVSPYFLHWMTCFGKE